MKNTRINVTQPFLPPLNEFQPYLEDIWRRKWVTNNGYYHEKLETELSNYLGVKHISLFANGTIALLIAIKALELKGEIITTPFSFVATAHSIKWNGIKPVFVDIESKTCNIDPDKIEDAITPQTTAILPVHVYGAPCDNDRIMEIAKKHDLKVIYDAAHAFGVIKNKQSIMNYGDLSILSFHATKVFNTFEGGAIVSHSKEMKKKIDDLKNFGFQGELTVDGIGINGKMNEIQSAIGLLQLKYIDFAIKRRKNIADTYKLRIREIDGISFLYDIEGVEHNYAYFPIFIDKNEYGISRDGIFEILKKHNIFGRRYFYPLVSNFSIYKNLPSANSKEMPVAKEISNKVICIPIYPGLTIGAQNQIIDILKGEIT
jgi:dTDP-4-amino-4,6-dideoxygalactose transaminase